jgi:peptidoglycan/xylan/chitin deacetylase (PgdA/CDA1 family)
MTRKAALRILGLLAGGTAFFHAAAGHLLWHRGRRRSSMAVMASGFLLDGAFVSTSLIPRLSLGGRTCCAGSGDRDTIALSFDDGPRSPFTEQILDILAAEQVPATFFVLGENAQAHPQTLQRMEAEGHSIANHGMSHEILMWAGAKQARDTVLAADAALADAGVSRRARLFRAPHGWLSPVAHREISALGYQVAGWTKGVWDTASPGAGRIVERSAAALRPGCILLLHDGWQGGSLEDRSQTVEALPQIIGAARERGLSFVTVDEMLSGGAGGSR